MPAERKVILYIAISMDGYIAKKNDDLEFLSIIQEEGEDYGYGAFIETVDTVIMGRRTYDWIMKKVAEFPHKNKQTYIITRKSRPDIGNIRFYTRNLRNLIRELKNETGKNIFIDGGAQIVNELLKENLIEEYIISIIPVLLGSGIRLFHEGYKEQNLKLIKAEYFAKGLVQLHYIAEN